MQVLSDGNGRFEEIMPGNQKITNRGEALFSLAVTFEHAPNAYPKSKNHIPAAVRFVHNKPEYCLWNRENDGPDDDWSNDLKTFSEKVINVFDHQFSLDPFVGYERPKIGFVE